MWRKRGSAKSNPRNSERCKSETARKHQNASKIQITRTQKKNTYRYEIWDQNPRKLPNLQDSPRTGIFFFLWPGNSHARMETRKQIYNRGDEQFGYMPLLFQKITALPWGPALDASQPNWRMKLLEYPQFFWTLKSCNDGVSHSILLTEMGAMMELRLIAEGLRIT